MWSPPGSGFEASMFSPAGRIQGLWRLGRSARAMRGRPRRPAPVGLTIGLIAIGLLVVVPVVVVAVLAAF
jgi:uncharacterized membrane protein YidH (DUF202 family)